MGFVEGAVPMIDEPDVAGRVGTGAAAAMPLLLLIELSLDEVDHCLPTYGAYSLGELLVEGYWT